MAPHRPHRTFSLNCKSTALKPEPTREDSGSSHSSETSSSSPSSKSSKFSFSKLNLHDAVRRGSHSNDDHSRRQSQDGVAEVESYHLPKHEDPVSLCETAISLVLSVPGPPLDVLRKELMPQLYWQKGYAQRTNSRENLDGVDELLRTAQRFRDRFMHVRVRFRSHLMDMDGTATMDAAAVALVYDILATPHPAPGQSKHDVHPLRGSAIGIHKVFEGKLAQTDLVVDTAEFQPENQGPQLDQCTIM